jgi:hypothetical protein
MLYDHRGKGSGTGKCQMKQGPAGDLQKVGYNPGASSPLYMLEGMEVDAGILGNQSSCKSELELLLHIE